MAMKGFFVQVQLKQKYYASPTGVKTYDFQITDSTFFYVSEMLVLTAEPSLTSQSNDFTDFMVIHFCYNWYKALIIHVCSGVYIVQNVSRMLLISKP